MSTTGAVTGVPSGGSASATKSPGDGGSAAPPTPTPTPTSTSSGRQQAALEAEAAQRGFSRSVLISGIRCTLTYVVLPFVAPFIGLAPNVGPVVGLGVGAVAIAANLFSIRRFWRANHRWKVQATVLHCSVLVLLAILMVLDLRALVG